MNQNWNGDWTIVTDEFCFSTRERNLLKTSSPFKHVWPEVVRGGINYDSCELPADITTEEIMEKIESRAFLPGRLKTSGVSPEGAKEILKHALDATDGPVIALSTSSYISSSSAMAMHMASAELNEIYDDRVVFVDSRSTSHGQMLLLELLDEFVPTENYSPVKYLEDVLKPHLIHRFTEPDLSFAIESGRYNGLSKAAGKVVAKSMASRKVMPYMYLPLNDNLQSDFLTVHRFNRLCLIWVEEFKRTHANHKVIVEYAGTTCKEYALLLANELEAAQATVRIELLPPAICVHTGNVVAWHNLSTTSR